MKAQSITWNIWLDHPRLGVLNISRFYGNSDLPPERVIELWRKRMMANGYSAPDRGEYARPYVHTALDNFGN